MLLSFILYRIIEVGGLTKALPEKNSKSCKSLRNDSSFVGSEDIVKVDESTLIAGSNDNIKNPFTPILSDEHTHKE